MRSRLVLPFILLTTACGGVSSDSLATTDPNGVEKRSLEATTSTFQTPTTTTIITTTPTLVTTTSQQEEADWASLTADDIHSWHRDDPEIPSWLAPTLTGSCEGAVTGLSTMSQLLGEDIIRVLEIAVEVESGQRPVEDGAAAFNEWGRSALTVQALAENTIEFMVDPQGIIWLTAVGEAAGAAGFSATLVGTLVFPDDSEKIDEEQMGIGMPILDGDVRELVTASLVFEGQQICSD